MLMGFWAREVGTQPRMQLTQMLVPPADFTKRWPDWRRCGMLRGLHAVLAFDEGYQSEGLQLLAWHIEASNARSGSGSREISQEDSRENSSLSKCNCSDDFHPTLLPIDVRRPGSPIEGLKLPL